MFNTLRTWLQRWFRLRPFHVAKKNPDPAIATPPSPPPGEQEAHLTVPYDENLLEKARTQWQFGDWENLARLDREILQHHPDRARLALLAATGHLQQNDRVAAAQYLRLAQDWGCSKKLIARLLVAGVHNSLGKAAFILGENTRALTHFSDAVQIGMPGIEARLLVKARVSQQLEQLGVGVEQGALLMEHLKHGANHATSDPRT